MSFHVDPTHNLTVNIQAQGIEYPVTVVIVLIPTFIGITMVATIPVFPKTQANFFLFFTVQSTVLGIPVQYLGFNP